MGTRCTRCIILRNLHTLYRRFTVMIPTGQLGYSTLMFSIRYRGRFTHFAQLHMLLKSMNRSQIPLHFRMVQIDQEHHLCYYLASLRDRSKVQSHHPQRSNPIFFYPVLLIASFSRMVSTRTTCLLIWYSTSHHHQWYSLPMNSQNPL